MTNRIKTNVKEVLHIFGDLDYDVLDDAEDLLSGAEIRMINELCTVEEAERFASFVETRVMEITA